MPRHLGDHKWSGDQTFNGDAVFNGEVSGSGVGVLLDGYTSAIGSVGDGYLAFFTGSNKIAGDNDLYWDRNNNRLGIHTSSPASELDVRGRCIFDSSDGYAVVATGGIEAVSGASGYALIAKGEISAPTRSAFKIVPQDAEPSIAEMGDLYVNSSTGQLYWFNGAAWVAAGI